MKKLKQINIRIDEDLYSIAKKKADKLGMPLATLVRVFLKSFTTQAGVGFYVGDQDLAQLFNRWMSHRQLEKYRDGRITVNPSRLRDIFEL